MHTFLIQVVKNEIVDDFCFHLIDAKKEIH
jgi:hypothetical protein